MEKKAGRHGCKKGKFLVPIQDALKNGELSGEKLLNRAKELKPENESLRNPLHAFIESLFCLLDEDTIRKRYDPELDPRKSRHSFRYEYYYYWLTEKEPAESTALLKKAIDGEKKSYDRINELFQNKIKEIYNMNLNNWETLLGKVEIRNPNKEELLWKLADANVTKWLQADPDRLEFLPEDAILCRIAEEMQKLLKWRYMDVYLDDKCSKIKLIQLKISAVKDDYEEHLESIDPKPKSISDKYLFTKENISRKEFLTDLRIKKPEPISPKNINNLLARVLIYIDIHSSGRLKLMNQLLMGLSDEENSKDVLDEFIFKSMENEVRIIDHHLSELVKLLP